MARIFITGSADGLGLLAAKALVREGHDVVIHARNKQRGEEAQQKVPGAKGVLSADLSDAEQTTRLADEVNKLGTFDAVIHNAGVYQVPSRTIFAVNTLAPYILTCLIQRPKRLIYLTSGMHLHGRASLENFREDTTSITYSDSKLHVVMLSMAVARKWPGVYSNSVNPGWVPTKMGGKGAPDDLEKGYETQVWLAVSNDEDALVSGRYFFHRKERAFNPAAADVGQQEKFLEACKKITGVALS